MLAAKPHSRLDDRMLVAHARAVWKRSDAARALMTATLAEARATAGAAMGSEIGTAAIAKAVDVLDALGDPGVAAQLDEALKRIDKSGSYAGKKQNDVMLADLLRPRLAVTSKALFDALLALTLGDANPAVIGRVLPHESPQRAAFLSAVRALPPAERIRILEILVGDARRAGRHDEMRALIDEVVALGSVRIQTLARHLAWLGDKPAAKRLLDTVAWKARKEDPKWRRAEQYASLAAVYAIAGDARKSEGFENRAINELAAVDAEELDEKELGGGTSRRTTYGELAIGRALRGERSEALALIDKELDSGGIADVALDLIVFGHPLGEELMPRVKGAARVELFEGLVADAIARNDLPRAKQWIDVAPKDDWNEPVGLNALFDAYVARGDVDALAKHRRRAVYALDRIAIDRARTGDCGGAIELAIRGKELGTLAAVAVYCPPPR